MINILARPAFRSPNGESSSLLMAQALDSNPEVSVFDWVRYLDFVRKKPDFIILHWPDNLLSNRNLSFFIKFNLLRFALSLSKLIFGTKIIWVAHNIKSHFSVEQKKEDYFWKKLLKDVDYIIYPLPTILNMHKVTNFVGKRIVIPFGPYSQRKVDFGHLSELKKEISFNSNTEYFLWFGLIRPYKNLEFLIKTFDSFDENIKLLVVGKIVDQDYFESLEKSQNVIFIPKFIEDYQFPSFMSFTSGCIFNYNQITNSGSIRMALTYNKPVFCNYFKQLGDFNKLLNTNLLKFYDNEIKLKQLIKENKIEDNLEVEWTNSSWSNFNDIFTNKIINDKNGSR